MIKVTGEENELVYSGQRSDNVYLPEGSNIQTIPSETRPAAVAQNKAERIKMGKMVYDRSCSACHLPTGTGVPAAFPPLAKSDYLNAEVDRAIDVVLHGMQGEVVVNDQKFNSIMPALGLNDEEVANVLTYVYSEWENNGAEVTPADVSKVRAAKK
jgi:nitrite reductase (NO-forming)